MGDDRISPEIAKDAATKSRFQLGKAASQRGPGKSIFDGTAPPVLAPVTGAELRGRTAKRWFMRGVIGKTSSARSVPEKRAER
jgi:hypothetical protein